MDYVLVVAVVLLDLVVLYSIIVAKESTLLKVIYSLLILLFPIIGVSIFYFIKFLLQKKG